MIRRSLVLLMIRALARLAWRLLRVVVFVAAIVLAAPVAAVAAYAAALAWFLGWPPRQLYRAAAWCGPMVVVWLGALAADGQPWPRLAAAPYLAWLAMWHEAAAGSYLMAIVTVAPPAIPLGLLAGGLAWSWRIYSMDTGSGGLAPSAPASFDQRQWRHQVRTARARIAAPGSVPLLLRDGSVVAGATIRTVRQPGPAAGGHPVPEAPLAPGGAGHDGDREDDAAAEAVGRVHEPRDAAARGGPRTAAAPRRAGLQGRGRLAADR